MYSQARIASVTFLGSRGTFPVRAAGKAMMEPVLGSDGRLIMAMAAATLVVDVEGSHRGKDGEWLQGARRGGCSESG